MATSGQESVWTPDPHAMEMTWTDRGAEGPASLAIHHPAAPFILSSATDTETDYISIASDYLSTAPIREFLDKTDARTAWIGALAAGSPDEPFFEWVPATATPPEANFFSFSSPLLAFRDSGEAPCEIRMLLACEAKNGAFYGSGYGVSIAIHKRRTPSGFQMRITGLRANLPRAGTPLLAASDWELFGGAEQETHLGFLRALAAEHGFESESVHLRGVRAAGSASEPMRVWSKVGVAREGSRPGAAYSFDVIVDATGEHTLANRRLLVAEVGEARVFPHVPETRPSRTEGDLDSSRKLENITAGLKDPLVLDDAHGEVMRVSPSRFVREDRKILGRPAKEVELPGTGPSVRSNDMSAVMAFYYLRDFFRRMDAYKITPMPRDFFVCMKLPLNVAYRSGMFTGPGKDGQTVNACVQPDGWPREQVASMNARPTLTMHLALANLNVRDRGSSRGAVHQAAEPLGLASDQRWMWHELGHVLIFAATGELELRFAHSCGDALAAIISDPWLSQDRTGAKRRGATFPFAFLSRRHDRCAHCGWSWGGRMHAPLAKSPTPPRRKGYGSEQILSSSLFRLYRALGGDTGSKSGGAPKATLSASHYTLTLIIEALGLLGPATTVPANNVIEFVHALVDADIGRALWHIQDPDPSVTSHYRRTGGCAHKLVRWAFEAQGLNANGKDVDGPGQPPPVDIYIKSCRTRHPDVLDMVDYGPGTYVPVPLDAEELANGSSALLADPDAIDVKADTVLITIANRGRFDATNVSVEIFTAAHADRVPDWNEGGAWTRIGRAEIARVPPGEPGVAVSFSEAASNAFVLAIASCAADPANTDARAALPCSYLRTSVLDLLAGDNNVGLRVPERKRADSPPASSPFSASAP